MRYNALDKIKFKVQFACARFSVDPSKKKKCNKRSVATIWMWCPFVSLSNHWLLFENFVSFTIHDLEPGTIKSSTNFQRCPLKLKWLPPLLKISKKNIHTYENKLLLFQCHIQESFEFINLITFPLTPGLDLFSSFNNGWRKQGEHFLLFSSHSTTAGAKTT